MGGTAQAYYTEIVKRIFYDRKIVAVRRLVRP